VSRSFGLKEVNKNFTGPTIEAFTPQSPLIFWEPGLNPFPVRFDVNIQIYSNRYATAHQFGSFEIRAAFGLLLFLYISLMIQPNELRINNLVRYIEGAYDSSSGHGRIERILGKHVRLRGKGSEYKVSDISPILLTEEWLLRFGFTQINAGVWQPEVEVNSPQPRQSFVLELLEGGLHYSAYESQMYSVQIEWVHQLQNLYFALVGEELQIK